MEVKKTNLNWQGNEDELFVNHKFRYCNILSRIYGAIYLNIGRIYLNIGDKWF